MFNLLSNGVSLFLSLALPLHVCNAMCDRCIIRELLAGGGGGSTKMLS